MFWEVVQPYVERGLISCQRHPDWPNLAIFNYTPKCQFGRHWDEVTCACRGLVVDLARDRVVARPFSKFFGLHELPGLGLSLPDGTPEVTVKFDGVLGISYRTPDGELHWATRGSFTSYQSRLAEEMWKGHREPPPEITLLCEIIHPEARIVVPYPFQGLILIGAIETETGRDLGWSELEALGRSLGLQVVERVPLDLEQVILRAKELKADSGEGFVLRWPDGFRVKVKAPEYLEIHRIAMGLSYRALCEAWEQGRVWDLLSRIPDDPYLRGKVENLDLALQETMEQARAFVEQYAALSQKDFALLLQREMPPWMPVAFAIRAGRGGEQVARKLVVRRVLKEAHAVA